MTNQHMHAFAQIYKQYGMRTLMRGGTITLARDVFYGVYFLVYEVWNDFDTVLVAILDPKYVDAVSLAV